MEITWYKKFRGDLTVDVQGNEDAVEDFKDRFLIKDMNGDYIFPGDRFQGYNNRKHTSSGELHPTKIMIAEYPTIYKLVYGDTFELSSTTHEPLIWKM